MDPVRSGAAPGRGAPCLAATVAARGTASDLVHTLYGRIPVDSLELDGDRGVFAQLQAWEPEE